jgi:hypothetical protein
MTIARRASARLTTVALVCALWPAVLTAQIDAGLLTKIRDRQITETFDSTANRTTVTLALVPSGAGGEPAGIVLMLIAEFPGRTLTPGTATFTARAHITAKSDPRERDPRTGTEGRELIFRLDPHTNSGITLYLYARSWGYPGFVPTGGEIPVAFFTIAPAELQALRAARAITGRALGSEFLLAPDQLTAIGEFARRFGP